MLIPHLHSTTRTALSTFLFPSKPTISDNSCTMAFPTTVHDYSYGSMKLPWTDDKSAKNTIPTQNTVLLIPQHPTFSERSIPLMQNSTKRPLSSTTAIFNMEDCMETELNLGCQNMRLASSFCLALAQIFLQPQNVIWISVSYHLKGL